MTEEEQTNNMERIREGKSERLPDDKNPIYLFSTTDTELLLAIVKDSIDPKKLAMKELQNRGLNMDGRWVGFDSDR